MADDKCGFGCKFKKFASKTISEHRDKKAKSYGFSSYKEWNDAADAAKKKGQVKAGKTRLKQIEKEYASQKKSSGWAAFDAFMGTPQKKKRSSTKRKKSSYVIVNNKAYKKGPITRKRSTRKRTSKEEPFFTF